MEQYKQYLAEVQRRSHSCSCSPLITLRNYLHKLIQSQQFYTGLRLEVEGFPDTSFQPMLDSGLRRVRQAEEEYRSEMERLAKERRVELFLHDISSRSRVGRVSFDCARNLLNDGALAIVTLHCNGCEQQLDAFGLDRLL